MGIWMNNYYSGFWLWIYIIFWFNWVPVICTERMSGWRNVLQKAENQLFRIFFTEKVHLTIFFWIFAIINKFHKILCTKLLYVIINFKIYSWQSFIRFSTSIVLIIWPTIFFITSVLYLLTKFIIFVNKTYFTKRLSNVTYLINKWQYQLFLRGITVKELFMFHW